MLLFPFGVFGHFVPGDADFLGGARLNEDPVVGGFIGVDQGEFDRLSRLDRELSYVKEHARGHGLDLDFFEVLLGVEICFDGVAGGGAGAELGEVLPVCHEVLDYGSLVGKRGFLFPEIAQGFRTQCGSNGVAQMTIHWAFQDGKNRLEVGGVWQVAGGDRRFHASEHMLIRREARESIRRVVPFSAPFAQQAGGGGARSGFGIAESRIQQFVLGILQVGVEP